MEVDEEVEVELEVEVDVEVDVEVVDEDVEVDWEVEVEVDLEVEVNVDVGVEEEVNVEVEIEEDERLEHAFTYTNDKRFGYVYAMKDYLPSGLIGLLLAAFLAAYMSTISTQLNWGASYLVNDGYKRFLKPNATEKQLVSISRLAVGDGRLRYLL